MTDTVHFTTEAPAAVTRPEVTPEAVKAEVTGPEVPEPEGSLTDQASGDAEDNPVARATYDARLHAALPGVDTSGSFPHRPPGR